MSSPEQWRATRQYLTEHRRELTLAAGDRYAGHLRGYGTPLLTRPEWLAPRPIPLGDVRLQLAASAPGAPAPITGDGPESADVRPVRPDGSRFPTYAAALGALGRPKLFQNRVCYRLLDVTGVTGSATHLSFCLGRYFDMISTCEAVAHEFAAASLTGRPGRSGRPGRAGRAGLPLREAIGDPTDLTRRPVLTAISALVLRSSGTRTDMVLHWRDPAKVATNGGRYTVAPAGMFQPSDDAGHNVANDFSLWRCLTRELAEELRNDPEDYGSDRTPIDYDNWPFARTLPHSAYWLGLGVDPLSMVLDMLVVMIFDAPLFDALFPGIPGPNDEGRLLTEPFTEQTVATLAEDLQPGSAAILRAAWHHRAEILGG